MNRISQILLSLLLLPMGMLAQEATWQTAKELKAGVTATGKLSGENPTEWYMFVVTENGAVNINVASSSENLSLGFTTLSVLNEANEVQERASVWGNDNLIVKDLAAGTYYIHVTLGDGEGSYTLKYTFTPTSSVYKNDVEPNNTWQGAQPLGRGHTVTGHLGYQYCDDMDTEDWWMIEIPKEGTVKISITAHEDLELGFTTVYPLVDNETVERAYVWGNEDIIMEDAAVGTYFIRVSHSVGQGAYSLQYKLTLPQYATDPEPNDELGNALTLEKGATVSGHLGYFYWDDIDATDWYCLQLPSYGSITVTYYVQAGLELGYVTLYDSEQQERGYVWGVGEDGSQQITVSDLEAGTYYLKVDLSNGQGSYLLAYASELGSVEPQEQLPDEPSDDPHAQPVPDDGTGTKYTYDPETNTMTVVAPPQTPPYVFKCSYPGAINELTLEVNFPYDIFGLCGPGDISVGAETPPGVIGGSFDPEDVGGRTLHVPEGTEQAYRDDENWGQFGNIVGDYGKPSDTISGPRLVVWLRTGEKVVYELADAPVTTFEGGQLIIRTNNVTVPYDRRNVLRYTYEDLFTGIDLQNDEHLVQINREGDEVSFRGLPKGSTASIYTVSGQLVGQEKVPDNQSLTISLKDRPTGLYIIKAATETIKVLKK
jgi:hypothetical protein